MFNYNRKYFSVLHLYHDAVIISGRSLLFFWKSNHSVYTILCSDYDKLYNCFHNDQSMPIYNHLVLGTDHTFSLLRGLHFDDHALSWYVYLCFFSTDVIWPDTISCILILHSWLSILLIFQGTILDSEIA